MQPTRRLSSTVRRTSLITQGANSEALLQRINKYRKYKVNRYSCACVTGYVCSTTRVKLLNRFQTIPFQNVICTFSLAQSVSFFRQRRTNCVLEPSVTELWYQVAQARGRNVASNTFGSLNFRLHAPPILPPHPSTHGSESPSRRIVNEGKFLTSTGNSNKF